MNHEETEPAIESTRSKRKILPGLLTALRLRKSGQPAIENIGRRRQLQMFGAEALEYAERNPATQDKIEEFIGIAETLATEKDKSIRGGSATRTMVVKDEEQKTTKAVTVEYSRTGTLGEAVLQERINSPVAAVWGLGFNIRQFSPGELTGFGPGHGKIEDSLQVYESGDPAYPYKIVYGRKVEDIRGQAFSEYLHDGVDEDQSVVKSERPGTNADIEAVIKVLTDAAASDQSETLTG